MTLIRNAWYVAAWPDQVTSDGLLARTICEQPLVLFRGPDGQPVALEDRCPHRLMPLSAGWIDDSCTVRCGYHGLRFDRDGRCVEVPGQSRIPERAAVRTFATVEKYGYIWVWPGDPAKADRGMVPEIFEPNDHPDWTVIRGVTHVAGNYQLLNDNLLDLTHETFLHRESLGDDNIPEFPITIEQDGDHVTVTRWILDHVPAPFWRAALAKGDVRCDRWQIVHFAPPSTLLLEVGVAPTGTGAPDGDRSHGVEGFNSHAMTPIDEHSTWYFYSFGRKFQRDDETLNQRLHTAVAGIIEQDRIAIEKIATVMARDDGRELVNLKADGGALRARRIVQHLENDEVSSAASNGSITSPAGDAPAELRPRAGVLAAPHGHPDAVT